MGAVPINQIETLLMRHYPGNDAAGPTRAAADRTQSVIGVIIEIARCLHPAAQLDHLAQLLPIQLELGIPPDFVPLALHANGSLDRADLLRLYNHRLTDPTAILGSDDETLLACVAGNMNRVAELRRAAHAALDDEGGVDFAAVMPAAVD